MTHTETLTAQADFIGAMRKAFIAAQDGTAYAVACSKYLYAPAFFELPDPVQTDMSALVERARQRIAGMARA